MNTLAWTLLIYMASGSHAGGPVSLPVPSEDACRAAYAAMVEIATDAGPRAGGGEGGADVRRT